MSGRPGPRRLLARERRQGRPARPPEPPEAGRDDDLRGQPAAVRTDHPHVDDVLAHDGEQPGAGRWGGDEPAQVCLHERQHLAQVLAADDLEAVVAGDVAGDDHAPPLPRTFCPKATSPTTATNRVSTSQNQSKPAMTESSSAIGVARRGVSGRALVGWWGNGASAAVAF